MAEIIGGKSLRQTAFDLNERGLRTTAGLAWTDGTLGRMLTSPRIAGYRTHQPDKKVDPVLHEGDWESIIDKDTWLELKSTLSSRVGRSGGDSLAKHLLTGLLRCGRCGSRMFAHTSKSGNGREMQRYVCVRQPGPNPCGRIAVAKQSTEDFVRDQFFDFMTTAELHAVGDSGERTLEEVEADITAKSELIETLTRKQYVTHDPKLPDEVFTSMINAESVALAELKRLRASLSAKVNAQADVLRPGNLEDIKSWWEGASVDERRTALKRAISTVTVKPAIVRGSNRFDGRRLAITWSDYIYFQSAEHWLMAGPTGPREEESGYFDAEGEWIETS